MPLGSNISIEIIWRADSATGPTYWANRLEASAAVGGIGTTPSLVAEAVRDAFLPLLLPNYWMDHIVLSSYVQDSTPYDPDALFVLPVARRGTNGSGPVADALPLSNVIHIAKTVASGRLGALFLRGMLTEQNIASDNNGGVSLVNISSFQSTFDSVFDALQAGLGSGVSLALVSGEGGSIVSRDVTGFWVKGVTNKKLRTRRKTRVATNALETMVNILQDGGVTIDEIPAFIEAAAAAAKALGVTLPPLLPE